jgi:methionyl-tRNA synthetase
MHVNSELNDVLGNFVHRTLTFINKNFESKIPYPGELDQKDQNFQHEISNAPDYIASSFDKFQLKAALAATIELARRGNQYLSEREPWHLIKTDKQKTATTLFLASQLVLSLGILISPFLPETAERIREGLNVKSIQWSDAGKLTLPSGHAIKLSEPLFQKISTGTIQKL